MSQWRQLPPSRRRQLAVAGVAALLLPGVIGANWLAGRSSPGGDRALADTPAAVTGMGERKPECTVRYTVRRAVNGRFSSAVTISNTGTTPINDWRLTFALPGEQRLLRGSPGAWKQSGRTVQVRGGDLAVKGSFAARFDGTYRGTNGLPTTFTLNGTDCQSLLSLTGQTARPAPPTGKGKDDKKDDERKKEEEEKKDED